ncbi:MAG: peroxiredoxin [Woeseiaceae bacterium]|jgi:peroxiredoxin
MSFLWIAVFTVSLIVVLLFLAKDKLRGKAIPEALRPGQSLPLFNLTDEDGKPISSADLAGKPAVLLFVRGSWCPFCSRQVANLTKNYKAITDSGARLILVTPKPLETTRRVADFFEVEFEFWLDESLTVARQLGLVQSSGVPKDFRDEYGEDTMWPTSLVVDAGGIIRLTELSRFIADRPNPEKLLAAVNNL